MSKIYFKLGDSDFEQDWDSNSLIKTNNDWSGVPSIMGYRGDGLASPAGRDPRNVTADSTVVNVIANQANPDTLSTGGIAEFHVGTGSIVALQGSGTAQAPHLVLYLDASGRENLHFSVDLLDIDGRDNSVQPIAVQYRIGGTGSWTNVPGGYVADASNAPADGPRLTQLSLDLPDAVNNQSMVEVRIMTTDASGSDEWIGLDNLRVTSQAMAPDETAPELMSSSPADGGIAVPPDANLTLTFNERVDIGTGTITISDGAGDVRVIDVADASQVSVSGQSLVINPADPLLFGTTYQVSVDDGAVVDLAGNAYAGTGADPVDFTTMAELTRIFEIQGAGHKSAYDGLQVNTRGVVTAIDTTGGRGFYIQDVDGDGNSATSDAVFVFSFSGINQVKVGDLVQIRGTVEEFGTGNNLTTTEVSDLTDLKVLSSGHSVASTVVGNGGRLPPTESIDSDNFAVFNPETDGIDFYESLEGMLLTVKDVLVVDNTYSSGTWVVSDRGANATGMNDRGGIAIGEHDHNPERIQIYADDGLAGGLGTIFETGDLLGDVTGVMGYGSGNYRVLQTAAPEVQSRIAITREVTALKGDTAAHLTVGAYNVKNLSPTLPQAKFNMLGQEIAINMGAPDILGLEEIQDNNGTGKGVVAADVTLNMLLDAIVAAGGPRYAWVQIDPAFDDANGGEDYGNIRNVILYNTERVSYVEGSLKELQDTTPGNGDSFINSRHPLTADFMLHGEKVTYVGVHNYARGGSDELFGVRQPAQANGDARRVDQTTAVRDYVADLLQADASANIVVGGDFNGFHFENSLTQLEGAGGLYNLAWQLEASDRYTSTYQGNGEQIDHLLVSKHLAAKSQFDNVHINTNLPFESGGSDHDGVLARVLINQGPVALADLGYGGDEDAVLTIDAALGVLANDSDINADTLNVTLVSGPAHGTLVLNPDGSFEYRANANYNGADSFRYVASDGFGGTSAVTQVNLAVAAVNDAPVAAGETAVVLEDGSVLIDVLANDSDVDLDALSIALAGAKSALGATLVVENGQVRYTADADAFDLLKAGEAVTDTFTYTADDGNGGASAPVTVSVTVREAGDNHAVEGSNKSDLFVDIVGRDTSYNGGNGEDVLIGLDGADVLNGGNGVDILVGGAGTDTLGGGNGSDVFVITADSGSDTLVDFRPVIDRIVVGYAGADTGAGVISWLKGSHAGTGFSFADVDLDGNGHADAVAITGGSLGGNTVTLNDWTVAELVGQRYLSAEHKVLGDWLL